MKLETLRDRLNMVLANYPNEARITDMNVRSIKVVGDKLAIRYSPPKTK